MKKILLTPIMILILAGAAFATPITGINTNRPVSPDINGPTIQSIFTSMGAGWQTLNEITSQNKTAVFQTSDTPPGANINPTLRFEYTDPTSQNIQQFGIWTAHDTGGPVVYYPIFNGAASPTTLATVQWLDSDTIQIFDTGGTGNVFTGTFDGIQYNWFGFYATNGRDPSINYYTYDGLNPGGVAGALAYMHPSGAAWAFFFETDFGIGTTDFNDMVVRVESIQQAVPEPATMLLLGSGLLGIGVFARRRFKK